MTELKSCPFCGAKAVLEENHGLYTISCQNYECIVCVYTLYVSDKTKAIEAWNRRVKE